MNSIARETLEKARLFLVQAETAAARGDRSQVVANIEAAIVFGRAVTNHIQKEYRSKYGSDFEAWYIPHQNIMKNDPLSKFFYEYRTTILKVKPLDVERHISLSGSLSFTGHIEFKVIRGKPWYRRSPQIIWEDIRAIFMRPIRKRIFQWRQHREIVRKRNEDLKRTQGLTIDNNYYFNDPIWGKKPAFSLVSEYLNKMKVLVDSAETHFNKD